MYIDIMVNNSTKLKKWLILNQEKSYCSVNYWLSCELIDEDEVVIVANVLNLNEDEETLHKAHEGMSKQIKQELEGKFSIKPHVVVVDPQGSPMEF